jgi:hypothetical protein
MQYTYDVLFDAMMQQKTSLWLYFSSSCELHKGWNPVGSASLPGSADGTRTPGGLASHGG